MANTKISELTAVTALAGTDVFPVVDVSASTTNKVSVTDLLRNAPAGTAGAPGIANADDQDTGILFPAANSIGVSTGGTQRLVIDSSGNVGIGTSSPAGTLDVSGNARIGAGSGGNFENAGTRLLVANTGGDAYIQIQAADSTGTSGLKFGRNSVANRAGIDWSASTDALKFRTGGTSERMRIDSSGRLLVGTTTNIIWNQTSEDGVVIEQSGATQIVRSGDVPLLVTRNTSTGQIVKFSQAGTERGAILYDGVFGIASASDLSFDTSGTERMRIDSSGNVGIGTTSPSGLIHLSNTSATTGYNFLQITAGSESRIHTIKSTISTGRDLELNTTRTFKITTGSDTATFPSEGDFVVSHGTNGEAMRIDSSGNVGIGTSSPSDLLHIRDAGTNADTAIKIGNDSRDWVIENSGSSSDTFKIYNDLSSNVFNITTGGNVGIGTASPLAKFHVSGSVGDFQIASDGATLDFTRDGANYIQAAGASATLNYRSSQHIFTGSSLSDERMRIDSSGNVGIGTSSVSNLLHLADSGGSTIVELQRTDSNTSGTVGAISFAASDGHSVAAINAAGDGDNEGAHLIFRTTSAASANSYFTSTTERMRIDSSGRLGIGTSSPAAKLHVNVGTNQNFTATSTNGVTQLQAINDAGNAFVPLDIAGSDIRLSPGSSEAARIDSSGRLLVGTTSTSLTSKLIVRARTNDSNGNGSITLQRGAMPSAADLAIGAVLFTDSGDNYGAWIVAYSDGAWTSGSSHPSMLVFSTTASGASSPTERMRINAAGNITGAQLASGTNNNIFVARHENSGSGTGPFFYLGYSSATSFSDGTYRYSVGTNGDVKNSNNSYGSTSDIKLKENIVDANSQWSDLKALKVRNYNFKEETGLDTFTQLGVVAQEVELVSPGLVSDVPDIDSEGNDLGTVTKTVNYSVLYMKAVKALQEAMDRIETLEAKVAALEAQ